MAADTLAACTVTFRFAQSEAVPTAQMESSVEPSASPVIAICVPLTETDAVTGLGFNPK
jgi:hypothetical protein